MIAMLNRGVIIGGLIGGTGCRSIPPATPVEVHMAIPSEWGHRPVESGILREPDGWVADFDDPVLTALIRTALSDNFELKSLLARYRAADARIRGSRAAARPSLNVGVDAARTKRTDPANGGLADSRSNSLSAEGSVAWELDVWRRVGHLTEASVLDAVAAAETLAAAELSLAIRVARTYCDAIEATQLVALSRETRRSFGDTLAIVEERFRSGVAAAVDVHLARANVANADSQIATAEREQNANVLTLDVLVGRYPEGALRPGVTLPTIRAIPAGLPADLMTRRADIQAAARAAEASFHRLRAAQKRWLPSVRLTASGGTSTDELKNLANINYLVWTVAGGLLQPIIDGGAIRSDIDVAEANQSEQVADYNAVLLTAFREVEAALAAEGYLRRQLDALETAAQESQLAETQATEQYRDGVSDITTVLVAQRRSVDAQRDVIQTRNRHLQNRLTLYAALGGAFAVNTKSAESR